MLFGCCLTIQLHLIVSLIKIESNGMTNYYRQKNIFPMAEQCDTLCLHFVRRPYELCFSVVICRTVMWGYATVKWGTLPHVGYVIASLGSVIARLRYAIVRGPKSLTKKKLALTIVDGGREGGRWLKCGRPHQIFVFGDEIYDFENCQLCICTFMAVDDHISKIHLHSSSLWASDYQ